MSYSLTKGDLEPDMLITLGAPGAQAALATATSVDMRWTKPDGTTVLVSLVVVSVPAFQVKRVWVSGDSNLEGIHRGQVKITTPAGEIVSDPNDGSSLIWHVYPRLGDLS